MMGWGLSFRAMAWSVMWLWVAACSDPVESGTYEIVLTLPHDSAAYTQGLLYKDRFLWESTGRYGGSSVRKVDGRTGRVLQSYSLPDSLFGEGLALVGAELVQLTWKSGVALFYDIESLELKRSVRYEGEGWGLCFDGASLYMTNGSDSLYWRDPETFQVRGVRQVTVAGSPVRYLNELECVGKYVYANVYKQDQIVQIEKTSGRVVRTIDALRLRLMSGSAADGEAVLNGIAYDEQTEFFFLTGKLWPTMYVVRVVGKG